MKEIRLQTDDGHFVADADIPFERGPLPRVVTWGDRTFVFERAGRNKAIYAECFAVALIDDWIVET